MSYACVVAATLVAAASAPTALAVAVDGAHDAALVDQVALVAVVVVDVAVDATVLAAVDVVAALGDPAGIAAISSTLVAAVDDAVVATRLASPYWHAC